MPLNQVGSAIAVAANGVNTPLTVTLAAQAGLWTVVTGFDITISGGTNNVTASLTGVAGGGTLSYTVPATASQGSISPEFAKPLVASAMSTAIALSVPALGAGNNGVAISIRGFYSTTPW